MKSDMYVNAQFFANQLKGKIAYSLLWIFLEGTDFHLIIINEIYVLLKPRTCDSLETVYQEKISLHLLFWIFVVNSILHSDAFSTILVYLE